MALPEPPGDPYAGLFAWEKRLSNRFYWRFFRQGMVAHPEIPHVVSDRARYLSWRGSVVGWMIALLLPLAALSAGPAASGGPSVALEVIGSLGTATCIGFASLRGLQACRRNPRWKRYKVYPDRGDWSDYGDIPSP